MTIDPLMSTSSSVRMSMVTVPGLSISTGSTKMAIRSIGEIADDALVVGVPLTAETEAGTE